MKRYILFIALAIIFNACQSPRQATGTFVGASLGSMMGSSIGSLVGGYRGRDVGNAVGIITGGMIGGLLASAPDGQEDVSRYAPAKEDMSTYDGQRALGNGMDDMYYAPLRESYSADYARANEMDDAVGVFPIAVQQLKFIDSNRDRAMNKGENCKIIFELKNVGTQTVYDVIPYLTSNTASDKLSISPARHISMIGPGGVMRYTAWVKINKKVKGSAIDFSIAVSVEASDSKVVRNFSIPVKK